MERETAHKAKPQDVLQTSVLLRDSVCSVWHEQNCRQRAEIMSQSLEHVLYSPWARYPNPPPPHHPGGGGGGGFLESSDF